MTDSERGVACRCISPNQVIRLRKLPLSLLCVDSCCRGVLPNVSSGPPRDPRDHGRFFCEELLRGGGALHDRGPRPPGRRPAGRRLKAVRTTGAENATTAKGAEA